MVRKILHFTARHTGWMFLFILGLCVFGFMPPLFTPKRVLADAKSDKWKTIALSDIALNLRMMAIENLKKDGSSGALDALESIAREGDLPIQMAACAQLGRVKSDSSKTKLKGLLEDSKQSPEVREAAAACIAEHWQDRGDIAYLESQCNGDSKLSAQVEVLKSKVYRK